MSKETQEMFDKMQKENGSIFDYNDNLYALTQKAYISISPFFLEKDVYMANAIDQDGAEYEVIWKIKNTETDDENLACEWGSPQSIRKL